MQSREENGLHIPHLPNPNPDGGGFGASDSGFNIQVLG